MLFSGRKPVGKYLQAILVVLKYLRRLGRNPTFIVGVGAWCR
jgi:hypothetical protein